MLTLANAYWWTADLQNLALTGKHLLAVAEERHLPESIVRGYYHQGLAHYQQNDLALAEREFAAVLQQPYLAFRSSSSRAGLAWRRSIWPKALRIRRAKSLRRYRPMRCG